MFHADHIRYSLLVASVPHLACRSCQLQVKADNYQYPITGDVQQMLLQLLSPTIVLSLVPPGILTTLFHYRLTLIPRKMEDTVLLVSAVMAWPMSLVPLDRDRILSSPYHRYLLLPMLYLPPPAIPRLYDDLIPLVEEAIALLLLTYNHTTILNLHLHHLVNVRPIPPDRGKVQEAPSNNGRRQKKRS
jgi:hypothetical protein